jgi:hypothetical protein
MRDLSNAYHRNPLGPTLGGDYAQLRDELLAEGTPGSAFPEMPPPPLEIAKRQETAPEPVHPSATGHAPHTVIVHHHYPSPEPQAREDAADREAQDAQDEAAPDGNAENVEPSAAGGSSHPLTALAEIARGAAPSGKEQLLSAIDRESVPAEVDTTPTPEPKDFSAMSVPQLMAARRARSASPPVYGPEINDAALARAFAQAKQNKENQLHGDLAQAYATSAMIHQPPDLRVALLHGQQAMSPVAEILARRQAAEQTVNAERTRRQADLMAAMQSPDSPESERARALFGATTVGKKWKAQMGDAWNQLTAAQVPGMKDVMTSEWRLDQAAERERADRAREDAQAKKGELDQKKLEALLASGQWHPVTTDQGVVLVNARTGETRQTGLTKTPASSDKETDKGFKSFADEISPTRGRGSILKEAQRRIWAADQLEGLARDKDGNLITTLSPNQMTEAQMALARLITNGQVTEHTLQQLDPQTFASSWSRLKQKITNEPQSAEAQQFTQQILDTAARETRKAKQQIYEGQIKSIPNWFHLRDKDPARFDAILEAHGIDPADFDEHGKLKTKGKAPASSAEPEHYFSKKEQRWYVRGADGHYSQE